MNRRIPFLVAASLLLAGCTVVRIDHKPLAEPTEEPRGEIRFEALRDTKPNRLATGYSLAVVKDFAIVGTFDSSSTEQTCIQGLKPGTYDISLSGRGIETRSTRIDVRPGQATRVRLLVRNARRVDRANDAAVTAGKVVLYTVGAVVYAVAWCAVEVCLNGDGDDDDDDDGSAVGPREKRRPPSQGPVSNYRKK